MPRHSNHLPTLCLKVDERMIFCRSHQALSTPIDGEHVSVCHEVKARALTTICKRLVRYQQYLLTVCPENVVVRSITTRKDITRHSFFLIYFSFFLFSFSDRGQDDPDMNIRSLSPSHTCSLPIVFPSMSVTMYALMPPLSLMSSVSHFPVILASLLFPRGFGSENQSRTE
jgi:hypothetical protein